MAIESHIYDDDGCCNKVQGHVSSNYYKSMFDIWAGKPSYMFRSTYNN